MAVRRSHRAAALIEAAFEKARETTGQSFDATLAHYPAEDRAHAGAAAQADHGAVAPSQIRPRTISDVYDQFLADPRHMWSKRTKIAHVTTKRWITEVFGSDTPIADVTREGCREFVDLLRAMPRHADKRFPGLNIREAVAAAQAKGETRLINTANLNAYVNRFGGALNWALDEGYIERNPLRGLKLPDPVKRKDKRLPLSTEQLRRIFHAPIYTGCQNDEGRYAVPGDAHPRRARFFVPLLGLFEGLRLNEICQLEVSDIVRVDGIHCIRVAAGTAQSGAIKLVKTQASERMVPVHDELIAMGFLAFVEHQRQAGHSCLFPELPLGHLGYRSTAFSRWFARFLVHANAAAPLTCYHSFRHNFRDALREAKVDRDLALVLGGWTTDGKGSAIADIYGNGYRAGVLAEALNAVRYPDLDLSHLRVLR